MKKQFSKLGKSVQKELVIKRLKELHQLLRVEKTERKRQEYRSRIARGRHIFKQITESMDKRTWPEGTRQCSICGGGGEAPTKILYYPGEPISSGLIGFCTFCKGKGYVADEIPDQ